MQPVIESLLAGLPFLLLHFLVALAMLFLAGLVYMWTTPHKELALIRAGNKAAAVSFASALIGLALPLALCLASAVNVWDIALWGLVTLAIQILAFRLVDLTLTDLSKRIERDEIAAAIALAGAKLGVAALNAAAIVV